MRALIGGGDSTTLPGRSLGTAPLLKHGWGNISQLGKLPLTSDITGEFDAVSIRIEEIDRPEDAVTHRPQNLDSLSLDMHLRRKKRLQVRHLQREVLHPSRCAIVSAHLRLVREFKEREDVARAGIEKNVQIRVELARRRDMILGEAHRLVHAEHAAIPLDSLFCIPTPVGDVMNSRYVERHRHFAGSAAARTPRLSWPSPTELSSMWPLQCCFR